MDKLQQIIGNKEDYINSMKKSFIQNKLGYNLNEDDEILEMSPQKFE